MLITLPDILSADDLATARHLMDQATWADGRDSAGPQARTVKNNQQLPHDSAAATAIRQMVLAGLNRSALFFSAALPLRIFTPRVNRYGGAANTYGNHIDNAIQVDRFSGRQVRTDVSTTVFLSEPDEYEGGELIAEDSYGCHEVKLAAGDIVVYPSTSLHRVEPVSRGARVASFMWIQSLVREDARRTLLFDMDMNIQRLRERLGDTEELVGLTSTYHNLLLLWAEV